MREKFWKKLEENDRTFRWFYLKYMDPNTTGKNYPTLQLQARGVQIKKIHPELQSAMERYINE
jgi:hypothetical protein